MRLKLFFIVLLAGLFLFSCGEGTENVDLGAKVDELASKVYNDSLKRIDETYAKEYVATCEKYADKYPEDVKSPALLLKAAETARNIKDYDKALALYDRIVEDFSSFEKAPQALFLKAFTLDDNLGKKEEAKALYESFIQKYPNDEFASSAKFMLDNLYKSDEEIIKEFEKKDSVKTKEIQ